MPEPLAWYGGNYYLTDAQMKVNATYIWNYLASHEWTKNAVCGMLGNMQSESGINPGMWQNQHEVVDNGYGLVQWTPSTKLTSWAASQGLVASDMDTQIKLILYEVQNNLQWRETDAYPLTFEDFTHSTDTTYNLAMAFIANFERPLDPNQPWRGKQAELWFNYLSGTTPIPPHPFVPQSKMPFIFYLKKRRVIS